VIPPPQRYQSKSQSGLYSYHHSFIPKPRITDRNISNVTPVIQDIPSRVKEPAKEADHLRVQALLCVAETEKQAKV
jgi:hypothetical protein